MKKNNDTALDSKLPDNELRVNPLPSLNSKPSHPRIKRYILLVVAVGAFTGLIAAGIFLYNQQSKSKRVNSLNIPTTSEREKEIQTNSKLSLAEKNLALESVAFGYLQEKKYDSALRIAKAFEKSAQYKETAFCSLETPVYSAKNDSAKLEVSAKSCLDIYKLKRTTDPSEAASNLYIEATMYGYLNDHVNEKATYKQVIKISDDNNLSGTEDIGSLVKSIKQKYKNEI